MKVTLLLPVVGVLCCGSVAARADLKWTEVMTLEGQAGAAPGAMPPGMPPMGKITISTTKWAKKEATRSETSFEIGPMTMESSEITHCDTMQKLSFDADLKMVAISPLESMTQMPAMPSMGMGMPGMALPDEPKPGKGTLTTEFSIQDLGKETVGGLETQHYSIKMTTTSTGCAGNGTQQTQMETWIAPIRMPAPCQEGDYKSAIAAAMRVKSACDVTFDFKGDLAAMQKAFLGFPMRTKFTSPQGSFTREVTMLSQAELDDTPFTIPTDWKKVSERDLQTAKGRAMMKKMMGGMNFGGM